MTGGAEIGVLYVGDDGATDVATALEREADRLDVVAETGATDALDRLADDPAPVDCVVSRYRLPDDDGLGLLEAVRDEYSGLPFVLFAEVCERDLVAEAMARGATDYLPRTDTVDGHAVLADRVETAVERYRAVRTDSRDGSEGSDDLFPELAETTDEVLYMFTADWDELLFVNSAYETLWGRSIADLRADPRNFLDGVHPDDRDEVLRAMERVSNGESVEVEYRVNATEDYGRWVSARAEPIHEDGEIVRVAGFVRDLTERKERERRLERERNRYATLFENLPNPVVHGVAKGGRPVVRNVNPAFEETFGYDADEVEDANLDEFIIPEGLGDEAAALNRRILEEGNVRTEVRRATDDGVRTFQLDIAMADLEADTPEGYAMYTDVTERKERKRQLERERDRFGTLFEAVPQPVVRVTLDGEEPIVQGTNETFEAVFGYSEAEAVGESLDDLIVPDRFLDEAEAINRAALETDSIQREVRRTAADGERDFLFRTRKLPRDDRPEALGIYVDITEQKRREKQLQRQNERLDEYASLISHDLRNPLNVLMGSLELAEETGDDEQFERCHRAVDRMDRLIDDLLTLARQGEQVDTLERVALGRIAEGCWETTETASATLAVEADGAVLADGSRLKQLLANLFRNAAEHGGPDVTVTVGTLEDGFYVADDGTGIPAEKREQVFESGYSTSSDGTGFGLLIVRRIAEAHDWEVRATESREGGARFEVTGVEFVS